MKKLYLFILPFLFSCENGPFAQSSDEEICTQVTVQDSILPSQWANHFNYPVGKPNAKGYYNAQPFGKNTHLGDDWNAITGGNSDLGDTIYAIANGYVSFAEDIEGGWGNVVRIKHFLKDGTKVESLYAHCNEILASADSWIEEGEPIGTIGTAHGQYNAHLHLEIRDAFDLPIGGGYSRDTQGYLDPTKFIEAHRSVE
jgi:murein DD-endopeptidase MepM/ murein hydrolase activator NlpD